MAYKPTGRPPGRPPSEGVTRTASLAIRLTPSGLEAIDSRRGTWSRAEYVRQALRLAVAERLTGPKEKP